MTSERIPPRVSRRMSNGAKTRERQELNFGGRRWGLAFRSDYLIYVRVGEWSVFLRQPKGRYV